VADLANLNQIKAPFVIHAGQVLVLAAPPPPPGAPKRSLSVQAARSLLAQAARDHGLRASFVQALSYWESGWNQDVVSSTGAVGLMQIEPYTAAYAGPRYLGRAVDIGNPRDNAELGAALLRAYIDQFNDPKLALAAYYQGPLAVQKYGIYPSSQSYVNGIWDLRNRIEAGQL
jgi:soluble lytic murein transglycosylase-like protein